MSLIPCSESECIDKILTDYNENVVSKKDWTKKDYYLWANQKYQDLTRKLSNPKNSQLVYKALNFIMYLDSCSIADKRLKSESQWDDFFEWERVDIKKSLREEFDPVGKEKKIMTVKFNELKN